MDGSGLAWGRGLFSPRRAAGQRILLSLSGAVSAALVSLAAFVGARRLAGFIVQPLPLLGLLILAVALALLCVFVNVVHRQVPRRSRLSRWTLSLGIVTILGVLLIAAAFSLPGSSPFGLAFVWTLICLAILGSWGMSRRAPRKRFRAPAGRQASPPAVSSEYSAAKQSAATRQDELAAGLPPEVTQKVTRARDESGADVMYGLFRAIFLPGARTQNVHLVFCPPFASAPKLTVDVVDGPGASVKAAEVQTYGARLEVRLRATRDEPADVIVEAFAVSD